MDVTPLGCSESDSPGHERTGPPLCNHHGSPSWSDERWTQPIAARARFVGCAVHGETTYRDPGALLGARLLATSSRSRRSLKVV